MRILVVGAGAIGGYFGGRMLQAGADVTFLVRERRAAEFAAAGLGATLDEVRTTLKRIRSDGYDVTTEQVTSGLSGIAAPLFDAQHNVLGSLSVTLQSKALDPDDIKRIAERIMFGARIVTNAVSQ